MGDFQTINDFLVENAPPVVLRPRRVENSDRRDIVAGIRPIEAPNYVQFRPLRGGLSLYFDSFAVQRVTTRRQEQLAVNYTVGSPLVDVFNSGPNSMTVALTVPDTAPFYSIGPTGLVRGYFGESIELLRAFYDQYFRLSAALGSKDPSIIGYVDFWNKGRVARGYLLRLAFERQTQIEVVNDVIFEMFVTQSIETTGRLSRPDVSGV